jgi:hypothetical protein
MFLCYLISKENALTKEKSLATIDLLNTWGEGQDLYRKKFSEDNLF